MIKQSTVSIAIVVFVLCIAGYGVYTLVSPLMGGQQEKPQNLDGFAVYLQRKGCFGGCTRYAVMVHGSGKVGYVGLRDVRQRGPKNARVSRAQVRKLLREIQRIGFFDYQDQYHPGGKQCPTREAAAEGAVLGVTLHRITRILHLNFGCPDIPPELRVLMRNIDATAGTARWTGEGQTTAARTISPVILSRGSA